MRSKFWLNAINFMQKILIQSILPLQIDIMHNLVHLYAAKASLSRPEKERKIQLCNKVLDVLTKVDSGYTIWRGTLLQVSQGCSCNFRAKLDGPHFLFVSVLL